MSPFAAVVNDANPRIQPIMIKKLAGTVLINCKTLITISTASFPTSDLVVESYGKKPALVKRVALPVLWKLLSAKTTATGDAKLANECLCQSLFCAIGPDIEDMPPPNVADKFRRLLRAVLN